MRHLYAATNEPGMSFVIDKAKMYERRRCDHRPEDYPEPLSAKECLASVVDPKDAKTNKHRYVVASQELEVRKHMRGIMGVPLVYINRSVMIMEPMAGATAEMREKEEKVKFRDGLKGRGSGSQGMKRKREDDGEEKEIGNETSDAAAKKKSKYGKGPKGPNPLSVKKAKKKVEGESAAPDKKQSYGEAESGDALAVAPTADGSEPSSKKKRRRKHKSGNEGGESEVVGAAAGDAEADAED